MRRTDTREMDVSVCRGGSMCRICVPWNRPPKLKRRVAMLVVIVVVEGVCMYVSLLLF